MKTVTIPVSRTAATTSIFGELPALCSLVTKTATCPRVFLADDRNPDRSLQERDFIMSMRDLASAHGQLIKPPLCLS